MGSFCPAKYARPCGWIEDVNPAPIQACPGMSFQRKVCFSQIKPQLGEGHYSYFSKGATWCKHSPGSTIIFAHCLFLVLFCWWQLCYSEAKYSVSVETTSVSQKPASELTKSLELIPGSHGSVFTVTLEKTWFVASAYKEAVGPGLWSERHNCQSSDQDVDNGSTFMGVTSLLRAPLPP